ncbi:hypothetical protein EK21DRAFT_90162 [Setomelanomma holmii]|uniref:PD-(D/E)XK nuclease-like domain-containing protein n=1 Tax=Setomelanomma holmii TaxID=210430 RepID=A0A9P4H693_9PLEO|nr:hypothetical protein EK21DRAFT_90162 [Setomelanomma holmii]
MAASPSPALAEKGTLISSWLEDLPPTPPADEDFRSFKRKRDSPERVAVHQLAAMSAHRNSSPGKRQRRHTEDLLPEQSASADGSTNHPLAFGNSNIFSLPSSSRAGASTPRRSTSPSRETIAALRVASPPIITEPLDGIKSEPPARVMAVIARLEAGLDEGWIPGWLEDAIRADTDIGFQRFKPSAFSKTTTRNLSDPTLDPVFRAQLEYTLMKVKKIFRKSLHCQTSGRDENAWCDEVVRPMVRLAIRLYAGGKLCLQSVQSQNINSEFLSRSVDKQRVLDRKADYALSYSHEVPPFDGLYPQLLHHGHQCVSHTTDAFTKTTAVFSGIEVKPSNGDKLEAEYKLSIFLAASLRKKAQLGRRAGLSDTTCLVEPGFAVVGHEVYCYIAYIDAKEEDETVRILEFRNATTNSISGVFNELRMWQNVIEYGLDEEYGGFWGGFLKPVMENLAGWS